MGFFDPFVPFSQRGDTWKDLEPIKQYDTPTGAAPICPVAYNPDCIPQHYMVNIL